MPTGCPYLLTKDMILNSTSYQSIPFPQKSFSVTHQLLTILYYSLKPLPPKITFLFTSLLSVSSTKTGAPWGHGLCLGLHYLAHSKASINMLNDSINFQLSRPGLSTELHATDTLTWMSPRHLKCNMSQNTIHTLPCLFFLFYSPISMSSTATHLHQKHGHLPCCFILPYLSQPIDRFLQIQPYK